MGVHWMSLVLWQVFTWDRVAILGGGGDIRPDSTTRESLRAIYFKRREVCDRGEMCTDW